jgi:hypothetical protein
MCILSSLLVDSSVIHTAWMEGHYADWSRRHGCKTETVRAVKRHSNHLTVHYTVTYVVTLSSCSRVRQPNFGNMSCRTPIRSSAIPQADHARLWVLSSWITASQSATVHTEHWPVVTRAIRIYYKYRAFHDVVHDYKHLYQENQRTYLNGIVRSHRKTGNFFDN